MKEIAELRRATTIDLSSNNIKFIPVSILSYFIHNHNKFVFQKNFGSSLVRITRLDLSKNQLKFLTDEFCHLINLKHLDLYNNQLESLPVTFGKLSKLRYLDLKGNPLQPALQKIVGPCLTSKDCIEAAKNIVPFMSELEVKLKSEQKKKEEEEHRKAKEEELEAREQARLAKKAARKERVLRERQEKAEAEQILVRQSSEFSESEKNLETASQTSACSFLNFKTLSKIFIVFILITSVILAAVFPNNGKFYFQMISERAFIVLENVNTRLSTAYKQLSL